MKILYAEDSEVVREATLLLIRSILSSARVDVVEDGLALVERALQERPPYDLVLTDNEMPNMSGLDAISELRNNSYTGRIWMRASDSSKACDLAERALFTGAENYYEKSLDGEKFERDLENL